MVTEPVGVVEGITFSNVAIMTIKGRWVCFFGERLIVELINIVGAHLIFVSAGEADEFDRAVRVFFSK